MRSLLPDLEYTVEPRFTGPFGEKDSGPVFWAFGGPGKLNHEIH